MTAERTRIQVELFGVPRLLAGRRCVPVAASTLRGVAAGLLESCPALAGHVIDPETMWLLDGYTFVVGERFTRDADSHVPPGTAVLLVASAAGG